MLVSMRILIMVVVLLLGVAHADARPRGSSKRSWSSYGYSTASSSRSTRVKGYTTKKGTYVAPYRRTKADRTQRNNYSTKGNTNPWTGAKGTRRAKR